MAGQNAVLDTLAHCRRCGGWEFAITSYRNGRWKPWCLDGDPTVEGDGDVSSHLVSPTGRG